MNLKETLLRGIYAYGFEKPSAIQQRAIIPCIKGRETKAYRFCFYVWVTWCFTIFRDLPINGDNFFTTDHSVLLTLMHISEIVKLEEVFPYCKYLSLCCQAMMSLPRPSQVLARRPHLPSLYCSSWTLSRRRLRLWCWLPQESWLSRYCSWGYSNLNSVSDLYSILRTLIQVWRYIFFIYFFKICLNSEIVTQSILLRLV